MPGERELAEIFREFFSKSWKNVNKARLQNLRENKRRKIEAETEKGMKQNYINHS